MPRLEGCFRLIDCLAGGLSSRHAFCDKSCIGEDEICEEVVYEEVVIKIQGLVLETRRELIHTR